jgi:hypothetical protein
METPNEILKDYLESAAWPVMRQAVQERIQLHAGTLINANPASGEAAWAVLKSQQAVIAELSQLVNDPLSYFTVQPPG